MAALLRSVRTKPENMRIWLEIKSPAWILQAIWPDVQGSIPSYSSWILQMRPGGVDFTKECISSYLRRELDGF